MRIPAALAVAAIAAFSMLDASPGRADQLAPDELAHKKDGGYVTGLPLFAYSTDLGLGLGARLYYYWDGHRDDPRFARTPYLYRLYLQAFASTRGIQFHVLDFDAPRIFDSPYRIRSQLVYARDLNSNYFGLGQRALAPLAFPGSARTYTSYADYTRDQQRASADGRSYSKYDQYDLVRPVALASIERLFADDRVRALAGFGLSYGRIRDYTGKQVDATDAAGQGIQAIEAPTRLSEDCAAGRLVGCRGGRDDYLRFGISYDTRDFEPDPNTGGFVDLALDAGTVALGSQYDYLRFFVGSVMTLGNAELRWTFGHLTAWGQRFGLIVASFFDTGRPYDALGQLSLRDWRASYGGAFRVAWNLATIVTVDYGLSSEDRGFYINFNHIF